MSDYEFGFWLHKESGFDVVRSLHGLNVCLVCVGALTREGSLSLSASQPALLLPSRLEDTETRDCTPRRQYRGSSPISGSFTKCWAASEDMLEPIKRRLVSELRLGQLCVWIQTCFDQSELSC